MLQYKKLQNSQKHQYAKGFKAISKLFGFNKATTMLGHSYPSLWCHWWSSTLCHSGQIAKATTDHKESWIYIGCKLCRTVPRSNLNQKKNWFSNFVDAKEPQKYSMIPPFWGPLLIKYIKCIVFFTVILQKQMLQYYFEIFTKNTVFFYRCRFVLSAMKKYLPLISLAMFYYS